MGSSIEWTDETWNPSLGCSRVSPGCVNCYAETFVHRGLTPAHRGLTVLREKAGVGWTGEVRFLPERLDVPLHWRKPRRIFVNSLSDLFHEKLTNEQIAAVFGVMASAPQHTFQVLTKRPDRMRAWFESIAPDSGAAYRCRSAAVRAGALAAARHSVWPLPNVWLGVSVEDQQRADERIPLLLETPAAVRFVSYEPALGPVDFTRIGWPTYDALRAIDRLDGRQETRRLDWVIVGGESGAGARPFDVAWARSTARREDRVVACFMKQVGKRPVVDHPLGPPGALVDAPCANRKGNDPAEWPDDLRVREFPVRT